MKEIKKKLDSDEKGLKRTGQGNLEIEHEEERARGDVVRREGVVRGRVGDKRRHDGRRKEARRDDRRGKCDTEFDASMVQRAGREDKIAMEVPDNATPDLVTWEANDATCKISPHADPTGVLAEVPQRRVRRCGKGSRDSGECHSVECRQCGSRIGASVRKKCSGSRFQQPPVATVIPMK